VSRNPLEDVKKALRRIGPESEDSVTDAAATLYECPGCERVYISEAMNSCPECSIAVEKVSSTEHSVAD
jgi:uncharacterized protein with PIN domain